MALLWGSFACTSSPSAPPEPSLEAHRPKVRLADREIALVLRGRGAPATTGAREALSRRLAEELRRAYRAPVEVYDALEPWQGLEPALLGEWARRKLDDAVVLELRSNPEGLVETAHLWVIALASQDVLLDIDLAAPRSLEALAPEVRAVLTRRWNDPGAHPAMDPLLAAHNLYRRRACAHAVLLYDLALEGTHPARTDLIARYTTALERRRICRERLALARRFREDAEASYRLETDIHGFADGAEAQLRAALGHTGLSPALASATSKPVYLQLTPERWTLRFRHDLSRQERPVLDQSGATPAVDFGPLLPVLLSLVSAREWVAEQAGSRELASLVRTATLELRLERLDGDALAIAFADLDGTPLLGRTLGLELGPDRFRLEARLPSLLRDGLFVLGPFETATGRPTVDALVTEFLGR